MFDPSLSANRGQVRAAELRGQFYGLKALIDAVPSVTSAQIDTVTTLAAGEPASVGVDFDGANVRFTFGLPRGQDGVDGSAGAPGAAGAPGEVSLAQLNGRSAGRARIPMG